MQPLGAFGGAPYGATKRVRGVPRAEARRGRRKEREEGEEERERGAPSLQNEDPTPQDGWEKDSREAAWKRRWHSSRARARARVHMQT